MCNENGCCSPSAEGHTCETCEVKDMPNHPAAEVMDMPKEGEAETHE
jgi:hypothetical protein